MEILDISIENDNDPMHEVENFNIDNPIDHPNEEQKQIPVTRVVESCRHQADKFLCMICHTILVQPVKCNKCKSHFCNTCITRWLEVKNKCPHCLSATRFEEPEYYLNMDLNDLLVTCKYQDEGCKQVRKFSQISEHVNKCEFMKKNCPHCKGVLYVKDLEEHMKICAENKESWKTFDYYSNKINQIEKDYKSEYNKLKREYALWNKRKQFKLKQLKNFDEVQKNVLNYLNKIQTSKD